MENEIKTFEVYKVTNIVNNKVYIGATTEGAGLRFKRHVTKALANTDNYPFHKAIRELGEDKFQVSVIEFCNSLEELNQKEAFYIATFNSTNPDFGYNGKQGGGIRYQSEESKIKIGDIHRGKISDKRKPILQYNGKTGEFICEYESLSTASEITGITRKSILRVINHEMCKPSSKNPYIWIYKDDAKIIDTLIDPKQYYSNLEYKTKMSDKCLEARKKYIVTDGNMMYAARGVAKYDENGNEIARYNSLSEASRQDGNPSVRTIKTHIENNIGDWRFIETNKTIEQINKEMHENAIKAARSQGKAIIGYNPETGNTVEFETISDAAKFVNGADRKTFKYHIDKQDCWRGYIWNFKE